MKRCTIFACIAIIGCAPFAAAGDKNKLPLLFEDDFEKGADRWQPTDPAAWKIVKTDKGQQYNQFQLSKTKTKFRSPFNISLIKELTVSDFVMKAKVLSTGKDGDHRDMCLFFGYQDSARIRPISTMCIWQRKPTTAPTRSSSSTVPTA